MKAVLYYFSSPYMLAATLSYVIMTAGLYHRKNKWLHARLMVLAISIDLFLVLILEFTRDAVQTAADFSMTPLQQAHIVTSTLAVALYIPVMILGLKRYQGRDSLSQNRWHRRLGLLAYFFRSAGFILMFSLIRHYTEK